VIDSKSERRPVLVTASLALPLIVLTALVVLDFEPLLAFDADVVRAFNGSVLDTGWLRFFRFVAVISGELAVTVLLVSLVGVFGLRRQWQVALWIATTAAVNAVGWPLLKILVHRSRPDLLEQIAGHSFPSGTQRESPLQWACLSSSRGTMLRGHGFGWVSSASGSRLPRWWVSTGSS